MPNNYIFRREFSGSWIQRNSPSERTVSIAEAEAMRVLERERVEMARAWEREQAEIYRRHMEEAVRYIDPVEQQAFVNLDEARIHRTSTATRSRINEESLRDIDELLRSTPIGRAKPVGPSKGVHPIHELFMKEKEINERKN